MGTLGYIMGDGGGHGDMEWNMGTLGYSMGEGVGHRDGEWGMTINGVEHGCTESGEYISVNFQCSSSNPCNVRFNIMSQHIPLKRMKYNS